MAIKNILANLDFGGIARIVGLLPPADPTDAATKAYVDARTPKITAGNTAPVSPEVGDIWIDTN